MKLACEKEITPRLFLTVAEALKNLPDNPGDESSVECLEENNSRNVKRQKTNQQLTSVSKGFEA